MVDIWWGGGLLLYSVILTLHVWLWFIHRMADRPPHTENLGFLFIKAW